MRTLRIALLATVATAAISSASLAADLILDPPVSEPIIDNSFSWDGAYIGGLLSVQDVPGTFGAGVVVGANATADAFLFGGEIEASLLSNGTWSAQVDGRAGVLVSDSLAIYGFLGIGQHSTNGTYVPLGVGAEVALADNLSFKAEYQFNNDLTSSAQDANVFKAGLNWHF
ncbi:MAG: autotransporter outer membrane beta-barrel domain-containing protein [Devosia sp.]